MQLALCRSWNQGCSPSSTQSGREILCDRWPILDIGPREARYRRRLQSGTQITLPDRLVQGVTSATYTKPVGICHRGTVKFNPFTSYARESHPRDFGSSSQDYKQPLLPIAATCASIWSIDAWSRSRWNKFVNWFDRGN